LLGVLDSGCEIRRRFGQRVRGAQASWPASTQATLGRHSSRAVTALSSCRPRGLAKGANAMINATSTRAVLGLMLLCAPALAIIEPSIEIRLGGAEQVLANTYVVSQRDTVTLAVTAKPGEMIWA